MATTARASAAPAALEAEPEVRGPTPGVAALIFFGLAFLYFVPALLPGRHIFGTDYFAGGYFFYDFVSARLSAWDLPKWVPYIFGGLPLFANPGSAYQPVHLLSSLLLPTSKVLAAVFVVHFGLAGLGMHLLAREVGCRAWIALVAGLSYQFTGLLTSWVYAGHDGRIIVATLAPLFFYFLRRGIRTTRPAPFAGAAATLGMALLSFQIQNSYYLLVAAAIWAVYSLVHFGYAKDPARLGKVVALGLGAVAVGFLLATVNFLPFLDYIDESPRGQEGGRGYEYSTSYSMPAGELLSLAVPEEHGISLSDPETGEPLFPAYRGANAFKLHTEYAGATVLVLLALGFLVTRRNRDWWFFLGLGAFMLTISLGGNTPLYRIYYEVLPGTKQFRAPSLSFFVVALSLVTMAALTLERLAVLRAGARTAKAGDEAGRELERVPWVAGGVVALAAVGAMLAAGEPAAQPGAPTAAAGWGRFVLFAALAAGLIALWARRKMGTLGIAIALSVVSVADLWVIGKEFLHTVDPPEVTFAPDDVVSFLEAQPGTFRIWTFPVPQQYRSGGAYGGDYPMLFELQQVGGEHPNPLRRWVEYLGAGTETYIDWHNVITEAAVVDTPEGQAIGFRWEAGFLEAANVRYIVSMAPLAHPALREVHRGSALVYELITALPRAYLVPGVVRAPEDATIGAMTSGEWNPREVAFVPADAAVDLPETPLSGDAAVAEYGPDRVVVTTRADRPALLVLADNFYEGWEARVDGEAAEVVLANHTFRGVVVPAGEHTVEFEFSPSDLLLGLYVSSAVALLLLAYGGWVLARRRGSAPSAEG